MCERKAIPLFAILFWLGITGVEPLKNVQIIVPPAVSLGEHVKLQCLYDMDHNESLYTVKWYLNDEEFYRYVPKEVPPIQTFPQHGMALDISQSDNHKVILRSVQHEQTGKYRCEVSADAPYFDTDVKISPMTVVEFPENDPLIEVAKHRYEVGERIRANCSFGPSRPAANITWFINDVQVRNQYITEYPSFEDGGHRVWAKSALEMDTDTASFRGGRLKLKCIASVYSRYTRHSEVQIEEEKPRVLGSKDSSGKQAIGGLANSGGHGKSQSLASSSSSSTHNKAVVQVFGLAGLPALLFILSVIRSLFIYSFSSIPALLSTPSLSTVEDEEEKEITTTSILTSKSHYYRYHHHHFSNRLRRAVYVFVPVERDGVPSSSSSIGELRRGLQTQALLTELQE